MRTVSLDDFDHELAAFLSDKIFVPGELIAHSSLSDEAKVFAIRLLALPWATSKADIASGYGIPLLKIERLLRQLKKAGFHSLTSNKIL